MGLYDSTYSRSDNGSSYGAPKFSTTLRLGDNSDAPGGVSELILNGTSGQLAWGVDGNGDVNSDINYPAPPNGTYCPVDLLIPASSSQAPAQLTVGNAPAVQNSGASYNVITHVLVEALLNSSITPGLGYYVVIRWRNLSIVFTDSAGNQTTNPAIGPDVYAYAGSYSFQDDVVTKGLRPLTNIPLSMLMATPSSNFVNGAPVSVELQGGIELISTDPSYKNYNNGLTSTSLQAKVNIWTT